MILCERPKTKVTIILAIGDRLFAICGAAKTKLLRHWLQNIQNAGTTSEGAMDS